MDRHALHISLRRRPVVAAVAASAAVAALLGGPAIQPADAATCAGAYTMPKWGHADDSSRTLVCLVNRERARYGLRPLRRVLPLATSAERHSVDMVRRTYFSHYTPAGLGPAERIRKVGYLSGARSWTVGENIAWGSGVRATPYQVHRALMNSPGHRANILDRRYRDIGIGMSLGTPVPGIARPGATYTQNFGTRTG